MEYILGMGSGKKVQDGGDICIPMVDSCWLWQKPTQYCQTIILQLKINKFFKWKYTHLKGS